MKFFLLVNGYQEYWPESLILKKERSEDYINFSSIDPFTIKTRNIEKIKKESEKHTIIPPIPFDNIEKSLLTLHKRQFEENPELDYLINYPYGKAFDTQGPFNVYIDGARKQILNQFVASAAGWIENSKGEVVVEFIKKIADPNEKEFEKLALIEAMNVCKKLNIKHINVYSDSLENACQVAHQKVNLPSPDFSAVYKRMKNFSSFNVHYLPRRFNHHADSLSKCIFYPYEKEKLRHLSNDNVIPQLIDSKLEYFFVDNLRIIEAEENKTQHSLFLLTGNKTINGKINNNMYYFLINNQDNTIELMDLVEKKTSYDKFLQLAGFSVGPEDSSHTIIGLSLFHFAKILEAHTHLKNVTVYPPNSYFVAVLNHHRHIERQYKKQFDYIKEVLSKYENVYIKTEIHLVVDNMKSLARYIEPKAPATQYNCRLKT